MLEMIDPSTVRALALPLTILLSYKVSSSLALRNWIAVSQLPTPAQFTAQQSLAERQAEAKSIKKRKWIVSLACIAFVAFELLVISKASQFELDGFFSILTAVMTVRAPFNVYITCTVPILMCLFFCRIAPSLLSLPGSPEQSGAFIDSRAAVRRNGFDSLERMPRI